MLVPRGAIWSAEDPDGPHLTLAQVPVAVQQALVRWAAGRPVVGISAGSVNGLATYTARIEQPGIDRYLTVSAQGCILTDRRFTAINHALQVASGEVHEAGVPNSPPGREAWNEAPSKQAWNEAVSAAGDPLTVDQLPAPARERLVQEAAGRPISRIHGLVDQGTISYRAHIRSRDGSDRAIRVRADGQVQPWAGRALARPQPGSAAVAGADDGAPGGRTGPAGSNHS